MLAKGAETNYFICRGAQNILSNSDVKTIATPPGYLMLGP